MQMKNRVALVTGAAKGIGKAAAVRLAEEGARVVIADIDEEAGEKTAADIRDGGGKAAFVSCDVGSGTDVEKAVQTAVDRFGGLHVLHNNAGIDFSAPVTEMTEDEWNHVINVNLSSVYRGCRHAIPHMKRAGGGSIINTASVQALLGFEGYTAYAAAKGGIISMTRQLAVEFAPDKIRVNAVSPGTINTPMLEQDLAGADDRETMLKAFAEAHALNRIGEPEEVADLVLFLASEASSFITGVNIPIDGGMVVLPS